MLLRTSGGPIRLLLYALCHSWSKKQKKLSKAVPAIVANNKKQNGILFKMRSASFHQSRGEKQGMTPLRSESVPQAHGPIFLCGSSCVRH
jgi:hypothetical protein